MSTRYQRTLHPWAIAAPVTTGVRRELDAGRLPERRRRAYPFTPCASLGLASQ